MTYEFHPAAEAELLELVGFYNFRVPGLGRVLVDEADALFQLIGESPKAWQVAAPPDVRRVPLQRFPLSIIYREVSEGFQVLAVAHDRRRPQYWLGRR